METRKIILFFLFIFILLPHAYPEENLRSRNVLILFAMAPSTPAYQVISDGIRSTLTESYGDELNLHMEYFEIEHYEDQQYPKERFELINQKYEKIDFDLLICVGIDIINPIREGASQKIMSLPAITLDFDLEDFGIQIPLKLNDNNAVIGLKPNILGTMKSAIKLFPDRHHFFIISGTSKSDLLYLTITKKIIPDLDHHIETTYISNVSMDDVLSLVRKLRTAV